MSKRLIIIWDRLHRVVLEACPDINRVVVRGVRGGVVVHEPPYDHVFLVLAHQDGLINPEVFWQGTMPFDDTDEAVEAVCKEVEGWFYAVMAEHDLTQHKTKKVDINDPRFRYLVPKGDDAWGITVTQPSSPKKR